MLLLSCKFYFELVLEYLLTTTFELELNFVCWSTGLVDLKLPEFVNISLAEPVEFLPLSGVLFSELAALPRGAAPSIF